MFWKKKKEEERFYRDCLDLYQEEIKDNVKNKNEHDDILELTKKIRDDYIERINNNELDIMSEKIRLEHSIGKYNTTFMGYSANLYIGIISGIFGFYFQRSGIFNNVIKIKGFSDSANQTIGVIANFITFMILIFVLTALMGDKSTRKSKKVSLINNIRLKVLEDIEKGNSLKKNSSLDEVAATTDDIEKDIISKRDSRGIRWLVNIMPIIKIGRRK
ncbi:hypothetical protein [Clostridium sp. DJ247]|uniref:hypothetical protein n=1 Tax=Clostridium sp. DJ247 TaxID=2726188 RepID=UPI0016245805|nr:hypothetical protein [Clostridium sp. DJ247]MBC2580612.1 hypothetical protein [Clostridium sp. DJ247]